LLPLASQAYESVRAYRVAHNSIRHLLAACA
jgi:hypothetical protein